MSARAIQAVAFEPVCDPEVVAFMAEVITEHTLIWEAYYTDAIEAGFTSVEASEYAHRKCRKETP